MVLRWTRHSSASSAMERSRIVLSSTDTWRAWEGIARGNQLRKQCGQRVVNSAAHRSSAPPRTRASCGSSGSTSATPLRTERKWVAVRRHTVCAAGVDREGPAEAAEAVLRAIQAELHRATEPLDRLWALSLDNAGHLARLALYHPGRRHPDAREEVEARAAAPGGPLAICLGSSTRERVTVRTGSGRTLRLPLGAYGGCLRTFPSNPAAKHWPARWCDECRRLRQTNERKKAVISAQATSGERLLGERLLVDSDFCPVRSVSPNPR